MMLRRILVFLALPAMLLLERIAYYGTRSTLMVFMSSPDGGLAMTRESARDLYKSFTLWVLLAPLLGGLISIATGPRVIVMIGALVTAIGYFLIAGSTAGSLSTALLVIALGQGLLKPGLFAVAGQEMGLRLDNARAALCFLLYGAINLGASLANLGSGSVAKAAGLKAAFGASGTLMIVVLVAAIGLSAVLQWVDKKPEPAATSLRAEMGIGLTLALILPASFGLGAMGDVMFDAIKASPDGFSSRATSWLFNVNPVVIGLTAVAAAAVMLAVAMGDRVKLPQHYVLAGGLVVYALGGIILAVGGNPLSIPVAALGTAVAALGEGLLFPLGIARAISVSSHRYTGITIAVWLVVTGAVTWLSSVALNESPRLAIGISVVGCLGAGVTLAVFGKVLSRELFDHHPPKPTTSIPSPFEGFHS
ncbi:MAG: hypothetical protein IPK82_10055 [Polyangiaceae bacterium]|nr:hypothetical protein [Polyangiaceae bacterium]